MLVSDRLFGFLNLEDARRRRRRVPAGARGVGDRDAAARRAPPSTSPSSRASCRGSPPPSTPRASTASAERPYDDPVSALRRILIETRALRRALPRVRRRARTPDLAILYLQGTDSIGHAVRALRGAAPARSVGRRTSSATARCRRATSVARRSARPLPRDGGARRRRSLLRLRPRLPLGRGPARPRSRASTTRPPPSGTSRAESGWCAAGGARPGRGEEAALRHVCPTLLALAGLPAPVGRAGPPPLAGVAAATGPPFDYARVFAELRAARAPQSAGRIAGRGDGRRRRRGDRQAAGARLHRRQRGDARPEAARAAGSTRTAGSYNNEGADPARRAARRRGARGVRARARARAAPRLRGLEPLRPAARGAGAGPRR